MSSAPPVNPALGPNLNPHNPVAPPPGKLAGWQVVLVHFYVNRDTYILTAKIVAAIFATVLLAVALGSLASPAAVTGSLVVGTAKVLGLGMGLGLLGGGYCFWKVGEFIDKEDQED